MSVLFNPVTAPLIQGALRIQSRLRNITRRDGASGLGNNALSARGRSEKAGEVFIVGAGPGDAELLTVKAYRLLQTADIVLFDWLVDQSVLDCIPRHIEKVFVGKRCGKHSVPQHEICQRLVALGQAGKRVVRLKGGDPAVFARTCEETTALTEANIPFAIVPGITAASGASAYTGIPLTDRSVAQSVRLMTAQFQNPEKEADWASIARSAERETTVIYMGFKRLALLCQRLKENGVDANMPVAVIENACCNQQQVIAATISDIVQHVAQANMTGPALVVIGHVVNARQPVSLELLNQSYEKLAI